MKWLLPAGIFVAAGLKLWGPTVICTSETGLTEGLELSDEYDTAVCATNVYGRVHMLLLVSEKGEK